MLALQIYRKLPLRLQTVLLKIVPLPLRSQLTRLAFRHRQSPAEVGTTTSVRVKEGGGTFVEALVTEDATPLMVRQRNLDDVVRALTEAGVSYFCLPTNNDLRTAIAVPYDDKEWIVEILKDSPVLAGAYIFMITPGGQRAKNGNQDAIARVVRPFTNPARTQVLGGQYACDVEFWRRVHRNELGLDYRADAPSLLDQGDHVTDVLVAPRPNPVADVVSVDANEVAAPDWTFSKFVPYQGDATFYKTRPEFAQARPDRVLFPIDAVYTWVDDGDPDWQSRKSAALDGQNMKKLNNNAASSSRYANHDELRYSLRSLVSFAPWIRHIYVVTDDQVPPWLDVLHPAITVVRHREIFGDTGRLPTFNSHAIESRLHRIAGLAEHFIYLNDDMFFGRPVLPNTFFHANGIAKFFTSSAQLGIGESTKYDTPVTAAGKSNRKQIAQHFERTITQKMRHVPYPLRRSVLEEIDSTLGEEVLATASHQFRDPDDLSIPSSLQHYWSFLTARAVPSSIRYAYVDLGLPSTPARLAAMLRGRRYDALCLNDTDSDEVSAEEQNQMLAEFLEALFPFRAPFEVSDEVFRERAGLGATKLAAMLLPEEG